MKSRKWCFRVTEIRLQHDYLVLKTVVKLYPPFYAQDTRIV